MDIGKSVKVIMNNSLRVYVQDPAWAYVYEFVCFSVRNSAYVSLRLRIINLISVINVSSWT